MLFVTGLLVGMILGAIAMGCCAAFKRGDELYGSLLAEKLGACEQAPEASGLIRQVCPASRA